MNTNEHEPLFTDLTPEQAAVVEGGATFNLVSVECVAAKADRNGPPDELYINFGGYKLRPGSMGPGDIAPLKGTLTSNDEIRLYDDDPRDNPDDLIAYGKLSGSGLDHFGGGKGKSEYILRYRRR